ncbi:Uncharacterised protein [Mycobacteroides abscessus subsp. abscessus]|nr:Uncharacterised protein [Mycobacteroides abscessus subsp. abscessus]
MTSTGSLGAFLIIFTISGPDKTDGFPWDIEMHLPPISFATCSAVLLAYSSPSVISMTFLRSSIALMSFRFT